jgi:hypothetical protein
LIVKRLSNASQKFISLLKENFAARSFYKQRGLFGTLIKAPVPIFNGAVDPFFMPYIATSGKISTYSPATLEIHKTLIFLLLHKLVVPEKQNYASYSARIQTQNFSRSSFASVNSRINRLKESGGSVADRRIFLEQKRPSRT